MFSPSLSRIEEHQRYLAANQIRPNQRGLWKAEHGTHDNEAEGLGLTDTPCGSNRSSATTDPVSIAASAAGIASLAGTLINNVGCFIVDANSVDDTVKEFRIGIEKLQVVLEHIEATFNERPRQQNFERKHWVKVKTILD